MKNYSHTQQISFTMSRKLVGQNKFIEAMNDYILNLYVSMYLMYHGAFDPRNPTVYLTLRTIFNSINI